MKKKNQFLNIKGAVLDNEQLGIYMEKAASSHDLVLKSNMSTYPIPRLKENLEFIGRTYNLLNTHVERRIDIYPAGEWLLDNFYAIEETVQMVVKELSPKRYKGLPGLAISGYSRIYSLAVEIVAHTDGRVTEEVLNWAIISYQKRKALNMEEIWNLLLFLNIATVENIRSICERIYSSQIQKYKVESILERLVEGKADKEQKFKFVEAEFISARAEIHATSTSRHSPQPNALPVYRIYVV